MAMRGNNSVVEVLENFHIVDSNTMFWTNIGATKQLIKYHSQIYDDVQNLTVDTTLLEGKVDSIEQRLAKEAARELVEQRLLAEVCPIWICRSVTDLCGG